MSPRAPRVSRAYLDQVIREEIERQMGEKAPLETGGGGLKPAPMPPEEGWDYVAVPASVQCLSCDESFPDQATFIAHDLAAHLDARIAEMDARLREKKGRA